MNDPRTSPAPASDAPAGLQPITTALDPDAPPPSDDGAPVVFTPDDITLPPPDQPPTDAAPESEKAALIFERS